jgi:hypothetical protein
MPAALLLLAALAPLSAQVVTARATAFTDLQVAAGSAFQSIAAGTDVSAGYDLNVGGRATARSTLTSIHSPSRIALELRESASAWSDPRGGAWETARVGQFPAHVIQIDLFAPQPLRAILRVTSKLCPGDGSGTGTFLLGATQITATADCTAHASDLSVIVGPGGLTMSLATYLSDISGWPFFFPTTMDWTIELLPDPTYPCTPTRYGSGCGGATLDAATDFAVPGTHVLTLRDPGTIAVALFAFGTQRRSLFFPPDCTVLNDLLLALPGTVTGGEGTLRVRPPALPGLVFQVQGAVGLTNGALHLSDGIELGCP